MLVTALIDDQTLHLDGVLDCHTLMRIWQEKSPQLANVKDINVSKLTRVDSSGLALLVYFCIKYQARLIELTPQLKTLIELYDLEPVVINL